MTERQAQILASVESSNIGPSESVYPWFESLRRILRERDLAGCYFHGSHFSLGISRFAAEETADKPLLEIRHGAPGVLLVFSFTAEAAPIHRRITERVHCPSDRALAEFDRLYAKFADAHSRLPGGEV